MSKLSDAKLADGIAEPESSKKEENDEQLHDIEHLGEDIKNKISSAGLSGPTFVDNLFKTFLAKKMEDIESEHKKRKKKKSLKEKKDDEDGSKSRKHKHKKKHKSKSSHKKSRSRMSSNCDQNSKLDRRSSKESDSERKSDHGSNSGSKNRQHSKSDRGSEKNCHGSHSASKSSQLSQVDHGSEDDHHGSNAGSNASEHSKSDQRSEKECRDSGASGEFEPKQDTDHISNEGVDHGRKLVVENSNMDNLRTSSGTEMAESNQTVDRKIESSVNKADTTEPRIKTATEGEEGVIVKPLLDDFKDDQERICNNDVVDANCQQTVNFPSQRSDSKGCNSRNHSGIQKELHASCANLDPVKHLGDSEAEVSEGIGRALEINEELCNNLNLGKDRVHDMKLVRNEKEISDCGNRSGDHGNMPADLGNHSTALDSKPLSTRDSKCISTDHYKDANSQSKDHSRKSKDLNKQSGSSSKDHAGRSSEQSDKAAQSKSSSERKRNRSRSVDCDKKLKDHGSHSKGHRSRSKGHCRRSKDRGSQSKDHEKSSRDHDSRSKDREKRSKDRDSKTKDHGNHSKDHERGSRDHDSRSKDHRQQSRDRDNHSKDHDNKSKGDETYSRDHNSQSEDRGQQSGDRDSQSKDHGQQSRDNDTRSKNCRARSPEKDVDKTKSLSEKKRDRSRSTDHRRESTERDRRSKDCRRQSKDHNMHTSEVDRAHSRTNRSSDSKKDQSRSLDFRKRSKDRSKSVDRLKSKRSRESSLSDSGSGATCHLRRLKPKKQKHRKRREKSVEIIEDDEMESLEASEKLTERLLKRLNTSIKRGQELKGEKDALLDPKMSSGVGIEEEAELGSGDEERKEEHALDREGTEVSVSGTICESSPSVAISIVDTSNVNVSSMAVFSVSVSGRDCLSVSSNDVPAPVQGPVAETGGQVEKPAAVLASTTKPALCKTKKPMMKMGIRLTETSVAIISSGVKVETEQKVDAEDQGGENLVKAGGLEDQPLVGDVLPRDPSSGSLPKQLDRNSSAETIFKTDVDKTTVKGDGLSKRDSDGGRLAGQKETNLKSESRKRRHSRSRSKERGTKKLRDSRNRDISPAKNSESRTKDVDRRSRSHSRTRKSRSHSKNKCRKSRSRSKNRRRKSRSHSKDRRNRSGSRSKDRRRKSRSHSNDRQRKSRSRSRERRRRSRSQSRDRRQGRRRGQSRSNAPEKSQEDLLLKIDKARLREIAIKKVYGNAQKGGGLGPVFDMKPDEVVALKSGGKSVEELTDFCKRIAEKEKNQSAESPSPEEEKPASEDEDMPFTTTAFKAREVTNSIVLNIRNSKPLPVLSSQEKIAKASELRTQFPVSSGTQHRAKEWVPVEKTQPGPSTGNLPPPGAVEPAVVEDKVFPDPPAQQIDVGQVVSERLSALRKLQSNPNDVQALGSVFKAQQQMQQWAASKQLPGQFVGSTGLNVLSQKDIFSHNPRNQAWVKKMQDSRGQVIEVDEVPRPASAPPFDQRWHGAVLGSALCKYVQAHLCHSMRQIPPGLVLFELDDTFTKARPVDSGIGKLLLQRMGWKEGEGLGKNNEGMTQPLMVDIKMDRKGLTAEEETGRKGQPGIVAATPIRFDFSGKHPVSALNEICTKRKWNMPNFILMDETGPSHSKTFRFKVEVNNVEYVPLTSSSTKKAAKLEAATVCLQQLGLLLRS